VGGGANDPVPNIAQSKPSKKWGELFTGLATANILCRCAPISADSVSAVYRSPKKIENKGNKRFISFKTPAKQERAVTW
jgi:hypothetical protein